MHDPANAYEHRDAVRVGRVLDIPVTTRASNIRGMGGVTGLGLEVDWDATEPTTVYRA